MWTRDRVPIYVSIYFFGPFSGVVAYMLSGELRDSKEAERIRFNSVQAIALGTIIIVIALIPFVRVLALLVWFYGLYTGYTAGTGREASIPYIGDFARMYK